MRHRLICSERATCCGASKPCPFLNPAEPLPQFPQNRESSNKTCFGSNQSSQRCAPKESPAWFKNRCLLRSITKHYIEIRPLHARSIVPKEGPINKDCDQHVHHARTYVDARHLRWTWSGTPTGVLALMRHPNMLDAISRGTRVRGQSAAAREHRPLPKKTINKKMSPMRS